MPRDRLNIVAIIPARYGSTRLPAKPLIDLCGKPMIRHVVERTMQAKQVNEVIVATDDERIATAVRSFGGSAVMTPVHLRSGSDRIAHVARQRRDIDVIVNVQGDEPLIAPQMIDEAVAPFAQDQSVLVGTLVKRITSPGEVSNPNIVKAVLDVNGFAVYFSRSPVPYLRNELEIDRWHTLHTFYRHIGLYVFRRDTLLKFSSWPESDLERAEALEQLRIIENGYSIKAVVTEYDSIPVDTSDDAERVRHILMNSSILTPE